MYLSERSMKQELGLLEIVRELTLFDELISVIVSNGSLTFKRAPLYVQYCPTSVCFVKVSINQWHHRRRSYRACLSGLVEGPRWDLVCLWDECCFFSIIETCVLFKRFEGMWDLLTTRSLPSSPEERGGEEEHVTESCIYDLWLKHYRQRRERAFIRSCATADDTVHASRDCARTAQGSYQRRSHLRVSW